MPRVRNIVLAIGQAEAALEHCPAALLHQDGAAEAMFRRIAGDEIPGRLPGRCPEGGRHGRSRLGAGGRNGGGGRPMAIIAKERRTDAREPPAAIPRDIRRHASASPGSCGATLRQHCARARFPLYAGSTPRSSAALATPTRTVGRERQPGGGERRHGKRKQIRGTPARKGRGDHRDEDATGRRIHHRRHARGQHAIAEQKISADARGIGHHRHQQDGPQGGGDRASRPAPRHKRPGRPQRRPPAHTRRRAATGRPATAATRLTAQGIAARMPSTCPAAGRGTRPGTPCRSHSG